MIRRAVLPPGYDGEWFRVAAPLLAAKTHMVVGVGMKALCGKSVRTWQIRTEGPLFPEATVDCQPCRAAVPRHWPSPAQARLLYLMEHGSFTKGKGGRRKGSKNGHVQAISLACPEYAPLLRTMV